MRGEGILSHQLFGDLDGKTALQPTLHIDTRELLAFRLRLIREFSGLFDEIGLLRIRLRAYRNILAAAIDMAPAASAAAPASRTPDLPEPEAAMPTIRLAVETIPSLAPRTAARSQPRRVIA